MPRWTLDTHVETIRSHSAWCNSPLHLVWCTIPAKETAPSVTTLSVSLPDFEGRPFRDDIEGQTRKRACERDTGVGNRVALQLS